MRDLLPLWMEHDDDFATLYVRGVLDRDSCASMLDMCASLPPFVRSLRLDLRAVGVMSSEATNAVRVMFAHWQATRGGEFRLSTSHLVATCTPARALTVHSRSTMPSASTAAAFA